LSRVPSLSLAVVASALWPAILCAEVPEPGAREAIAAATTEARFLSPWVADLPDSPTVPSPTEALGHIAGAPGELTRTSAIYAYYRALAKASDRVKVEVIGTTEEGREILLLAVGEPADLRDLDAARDDMAVLADPRRGDAARAEEIIARRKPFYMLHGGLHSTETGSPEMLMELVYRLVVSDAPHIQQIRDNVVVLINPVAEPDGRDRAVDWFYRHLKGKTDYENLPPISPPYWGKYVFHDNNRDGIQRKLALTRATQDAFLKWHPVVVHDLHESIPLLAIWTGTGPYNVNVDPSTFAEWHTISFHELTTLTSFGMPGVMTWGFGEGWGHFYADSVAINHNAIGRGYETFGNGTAETVERRIDPDDNKFANVPVTEREWYRPVPVPKKVRWSLRDNTNYMETGVLSALQFTALNRRDMLRNFWRRGRNAVEKGRTEKPYAIVIPEKQDDPRRLAALVNTLREHGIEVSRARDTFRVKEGAYPKGTYVVRLEQPYRGYALDLLLAQKFPAEKTPYEPYDDVGWALPFSYGVEVKSIDDATVRDVPTDLVTEVVAPQGSITGEGPVFLVKDTGQEALLAARVRLAGVRVEAAEKAFGVKGVAYPAGSWIIPAGQAGAEEKLAAVARDLALQVTRTGVAPDVSRHPVDLPRLGLLVAWGDTQSAGWVRMIFDHQGIPYTLVMDEDVRRGGLRERFDVLLMPNSDDSLKNMVNGIDPKHGPLDYTRTEQFPTHGFPTSSPDITGGLGWKGVQHIDDFVREGGLLVTLGGASTLPLDGGIAKDVRRASVKEVHTPGSELRARFRRPSHPIAYGYPETTSVFREVRPLYSVRKVDEARIVLQWGTEIPRDDEEEEDDAKDADKRKKDPLVVSGGIKGADEVEGKPAILDIPTGQGRVVAFDFDPIHRYLTLSDFRLVWNVLLNWDDLP
jgi:hypothetical protein